MGRPNKEEEARKRHEADLYKLERAERKVLAAEKRLALAEKGLVFAERQRNKIAKRVEKAAKFYGAEID